MEGDLPQFWVRFAFTVITAGADNLERPEGLVTWRAGAQALLLAAYDSRPLCP